MIDHATLAMLGDNPVRHFMTSVKGAFVIAATLHFIGLCLLAGAMLVVDLRVLGWLRGLSLDGALKFLRLAIAGFLINLTTGLCFLATRPRLLNNPAFRVKMALVLLAGLNALWFHYRVRPRLAALPIDASVGGVARSMAFASLLLWGGVIVVGRFMPLFSIL